MVTVVVMLAAFAVGGIPVGLLLGRRAGVDVRSEGSGNIGATNVARTAGRALGLVTLALDAAKGAGPALAGAALGGPRLAAGAGCAAVLGHVFSPYLGFRGGKGVATAAGAFVVLAPGATLLAVGLFGLVVALTRVVSLGSVAAALVLPVAAGLLGAPPDATGLAAAVAVLVGVRHAGNLLRLARGEESRLGGGNEPQNGDCRPAPGGAGPQGRPAPPPEESP